MKPQEQRWKLEELARHAGVSPRTVRYYVQRGLLPPPVFRGRDTAYEQEHLIRLHAIRRLQERFLPLDTIQGELDRRSLAELQALADGREETAPVARLALSASRPMPTLQAVERDGEQWQRWVVVPGLELHLSAQASPATRRVAHDLLSEHARRRAKDHPSS
jgi:Ca-activated chloride channel family protein